MPESEKKKLFDIMSAHNIAFAALAYRCNSQADVWEFQRGNPIDRADAEKLVEELNKLCGTQYTLDDFDICFCQAEAGSNEPLHRIPICFKHRLKYNVQYHT